MKPCGHDTDCSFSFFDFTGTGHIQVMTCGAGRAFTRGRNCSHPSHTAASRSTLTCHCYSFSPPCEGLLRYRGFLFVPRFESCVARAIEFQIGLSCLTLKCIINYKPILSVIFFIWNICILNDRNGLNWGYSIRCCGLDRSCSWRHQNTL